MEASVKPAVTPSPHHDVAGPVGLASSIGLASINWVVNLEFAMRLGIDFLTIIAVCLTIRYYWKKKSD